MENYQFDGNPIDWLFSQELLLSNRQPSFGIEPSLITNGTTTLQPSLAPTITNSISSSSHSSTTTDCHSTPAIDSPENSTRPKKHGKRQRVGDSNAQPSISEYFNVTQQFLSIVPVSHPLYSISAWSCSRVNCFTRTPLPNQPLDYFKDPFIFGKFAVNIFDPSIRPTSPEHLNETFSRLSGRSVHLIVSELPLVSDPRQLDSGFAIIVAARRIKEEWQAICMVSCEDITASKTRIRTNEITFRGNLEHCKGESGRRFWGQRSSHVRKTERGESFKPLRIEPRGKQGIEMVEEYCFFVSLFEENGKLLRHVDRSACLAQSNVVRFEPKTSKDSATETDARYSGLMREINKLSLFDRTNLSTLYSVDERLKTLLAVTDEKMLESVGVKTFSLEKLPKSAIELSRYLQKYLDSISSDQISDSSAEVEYKTRLGAVAKQIGLHHTDQSLLDGIERSFDVGSTLGANTRYYQILTAGIDDAVEWMHTNGVTKPNIHAVAARAEHVGYLMRDLRFKSRWMISMNNVYPDRVLVDSKDANKVYCLANTTYEAEIGLRDRLAPLVRLAFCSKIHRDQIKETILVPYCQGFLERYPDIEVNKNDIMQTRIGEPYSTILIDEDKFFIALHAMFLDFFLYWIRFRSIDSVKRIAQRLLEDEEKLNPWFFEPSRLVKFD